MVDPSWLTAAVGASAAVAEGSDRENLLAEIKTLSPPAFDRSAVDAWNDLVSSDRARLLPRASLVREAKRLIESGSMDKGRCPLCGQKVDGDRLAERIESALVDVMAASRDLERVRDPIVQLADDLEAAYQRRLSIHGRARATELDVPPVPDLAHAALRHGVDTLAPVEIDGITARCPTSASGTDQRARSHGRRRLRNPVHATPSSSCWPPCVSR